MERFVAFLRGINVGGRTVVKEKLTEAFTSLGFQQVSTYKQSGNVVFETETVNLHEIEDKIEDKLRSMLGYEVPVFIRSFPQLKSIIEHDAFKSQDEEGTSFLVTLLATAPANFPATVTSDNSEVHRTSNFSERYGSFQRDTWRW